VNRQVYDFHCGHVPPFQTQGSKDMRFIAISAALIVLSAAVPASAQYDFDDFMQAVKSGQQKTRNVYPTHLAQFQDDAPQRLASDVESLQPISSEGSLDPLALTEPQSLASVNQDALIQDQEAQALGATYPEGSAIYPEANATYPAMPYAVPQAGSCGCDHRSSHGGRLVDCPVMPHQPVNLPAPATVRGYFNAPPCIANVWDGYSCEAGAACKRTQDKINGVRHANRCDSGRCSSGCP
jgi:hypothetical protein